MGLIYLEVLGVHQGKNFDMMTWIWRLVAVAVIFLIGFAHGRRQEVVIWKNCNEAIEEWRGQFK